MSKNRLDKTTCSDLVELITLLNGAAVGNSGTLALLNSVEAFGAGLKSSSQAHAALSTVQLSALTDCLVALRRPLAAPVATAATAGYIAGANALPPGAPVVT